MRSELEWWIREGMRFSSFLFAWLFCCIVERPGLDWILTVGRFLGGYREVVFWAR